MANMEEPANLVRSKRMSKEEFMDSMGMLTLIMQHFGCSLSASIEVYKFILDYRPHENSSTLSKMLKGDTCHFKKDE